MLRFKVRAIITDHKELPQNSTVYLFNKEKCVLLPIKMSSFAANNILLAKDANKEIRPHMHNTTIRLVRALGGKIKSIIINDCQNNIFYSYIRVVRKEKVWDVDSKPSDSLAIALRLNIPIFVKKSVYKKLGIKITKDLLERSI